jgi:hypothetical protein
LCSFGKISGRSGQAEHRPEKRVTQPRTSSTASPTMPGQGCLRLPAGSARTWLQQRCYSERCRNHPPSRGAYPRRAQESPRRRRGPTGRELCLPEAGVPPRALRRDFPVHAGSLGPHRAHAEHRACGPGSPRQRAPPPRRSSPPRREGAPRLPPQAWGTLRQWGGSEPLARTTRSAGFSAGPYVGRRSRPGSEPRLPSPSTRGSQSRSCGSRTTDWPTSWVAWTMTTSSSATFPCSSPTLPEPGWSICLLRRSPTRTTWSKPSPATSRAHTCALETPGISEAVASSRENPSETTSGDFRISAPSCPTSPTQMSSARSSPAPLAVTW